MASKYTIILTNDPVQNRQAIHNSTIPEPEKSWLISYSHNQDSIKVSKPDVDAASKLNGQKARDAEGARDEVAKHTNKPFKWPSAEEIARDPSIVMTSALQALGPTGVAAGIFTLIFSKWIFNNNWTGFDLVAKVGAAFF